MSFFVFVHRNHIRRSVEKHRPASPPTLFRLAAETWAGGASAQCALQVRGQAGELLWRQFVVVVIIFTFTLIRKAGGISWPASRLPPNSLSNLKGASSRLCTLL